MFSVKDNKGNNMKATKEDTERKGPIQAYVKGFGNHMGAAIEHIQLAANLYAEALQKYGDDAHEAFASAYPHVTQNTWDKLRLVGNGEADAKIMLLSDKFAARIVRLPIEKQHETLNGDSFCIVNPTTRKMENINYGEIMPRHERILFDDEKGKIRGIEEQVRYIDEQNRRRKAQELPYTVETDALVVHKACRIGKVELEDALEAMA